MECAYSGIELVAIVYNVFDDPEAEGNTNGVQSSRYYAVYIILCQPRFPVYHPHSMRQKLENRNDPTYAA